MVPANELSYQKRIFEHPTRRQIFANTVGRIWRLNLTLRKHRITKAIAKNTVKFMYAYWAFYSIILWLCYCKTVISEDRLNARKNLHRVMTKRSSFSKMEPKSFFQLFMCVLGFLSMKLIKKRVNSRFRVCFCTLYSPKLLCTRAIRKWPSPLFLKLSKSTIADSRIILRMGGGE